MNPRIKTQIKIWVITALLSISSIVIGDQYGKANDCKAGQIDGQCGLGTAVGIIYGLIGAVLVMIGAICYSVYRYKRDSKYT
jgi:hypothetical protein